MAGTAQAPSTKGVGVGVGVGDIVLVLIDHGIRRPLLVASASIMPVGTHSEYRVSGTLHCLPQDRGAELFRGGAERPGDPLTVYSRPDLTSVVVGLGHAKQGHRIGEWIPRGGAK